MKKIFWCSVAVAMAAAGSVYLASRSVESYSLTRTGHALVSLGGEEGAATEDIPSNPEPAAVGGLLPGVTEELTAPIPPAIAPSEAVPVAQGPSEGRITIEESDLVAPTTSDFATQTAETAPAAQAKLPVMPYCSDDAEACNRRMPMAEEDESGEEEAEAWELLRQAANEANEEAASTPETLPVMPQEVVEQEQPVQENQDCHHHHHGHEMVCPYSGRSYPLPAISPSAPEPAEPTKGNNKKKESSMDDGEEQEPMAHQKLDTMEFRPSDAGFQHFIPGPF